MGLSLILGLDDIADVLDDLATKSEVLEQTIIDKIAGLFTT